MGYGPWSGKESDATEWLTFSHSTMHIEWPNILFTKVVANTDVTEYEEENIYFCSEIAQGWGEVRTGTLRKDDRKQMNDVANERELKTSPKKPDDLTFFTQEWNRAGKEVTQKITHWQLGWCQCSLDQPQISRQIFVKLWSGIKRAPCRPGPHWHFRNQWTKMDLNGWI